MLLPQDAIVGMIVKDTEDPDWGNGTIYEVGESLIRVYFDNISEQKVYHHSMYWKDLELIGYSDRLIKEFSNLKKLLELIEDD